MYGIVGTMNQLSTEKRTAVVAALVEGNSLRGTARLTGVARMTIEKLLRDLGAACAAYHDANVRNLKSQRIQCDEIWAFIGAKAKNATPEQKAAGWGDCWTWTAIDADSKLIVAYDVGPRAPQMAYDFMQNVASRLANRVQLTTDSLKMYLNAVEYAFGTNVDYAMLEKHYASVKRPENAVAKYSPPKLTGSKRAIISGVPDRRHISTSYVERQNLTMRMHMRRFGRLTNAFSKKVEMHGHAVALHFAYYNWCKIHQSLRVTPAMEAGIAAHAWSLEELVELVAPQSQRSEMAASS
jgi:IS1 family transposase